MIKRKLNLALAAMGFGLALASVPATAAITFFSPVTTFEDDNIDYVFDNDSSGTLTIGDRLVSVLEFNVTTGVLPGQGPNDVGPGLELTGIADITVVGIDIPTGTLIFAPTNDGLGEEGILGGFADGTAVALWTDTSPDLNVINATCGTRAQCYALAGLDGGLPGGDGSELYATLGFFDPDNAWTSLPANGGGSIATVQNGAPTQNFGGFNYSLDFGINNTGRTFGQQACAPVCGFPGDDGLVDVVGSGNILGGRFLNPAEWTARSDNDASVVPLRVPEPGTLALLGIALTAVGFRTRRQRPL